MSKKQQTTEKTHTIGEMEFCEIKQGLMVIRELTDLQSWACVDSAGFLWVASDIARNIEKLLGIKREED